MNNPKLVRRLQELESENYPTDIIYTMLAEEFPNSMDKELVQNDIRESNTSIYEEMKAIGMIPFHESLLISTNTLYDGETNGKTDEAQEGEKNETKERTEGEETQERTKSQD